MLDLVIQNFLKNPKGQLDAGLITFMIIGLVQFVNLLQLRLEDSGVLLEFFGKLLQKHLFSIVIAQQVGRGFAEYSFEVVAGPLDSVLDLVGEILEGAKGDALLGRVY